MWPGRDWTVPMQVATALALEVDSQLLADSALPLQHTLQDAPDL